VLIQLVVNEHMLLDTAFRNDLLNWLTGRDGVHGVYLIVEIQKRNKQLKDIKLLSALLAFIDILRLNSVEVLVGYTNTEAFLLSIADVTAVTLGSYETTRIFDIRSFEAEKRSATSPTREFIHRVFCTGSIRTMSTLLITLTEGQAIILTRRHIRRKCSNPRFSGTFRGPNCTNIISWFLDNS
jgi:hypothetical protein